MSTTLPWITGIGGVALGIAGVVYGIVRDRAARRESRRSAVLARNQRQLDEFYSPVLGKLERIRERSQARLEFGNAMSASQSSLSSEEMEGAIDFNNSVLRDELLPLYKEVAELFQENAGLVEPSTREIRSSLVRFLDVWERSASTKISFHVLQELQNRGATRDPIEPLYKDVKAHVDRINWVLNES